MREAFRTRDLVCMAKGVLMGRHAVDEATAFGMLLPGGRRAARRWPRPHGRSSTPPSAGAGDAAGPGGPRPEDPAAASGCATRTRTPG